MIIRRSEVKAFSTCYFLFKLACSPNTWLVRLGISDFIVTLGLNQVRL